MNVRRSIAVAAAVVAAPVMSSCGVNFDAQTDQVYNPAVGVNDRSGSVDVLNALIVSKAPGSGTVVATLVNNDEERADESRPLRHRDPLDAVELHVGVVERRAYDGRDELEVAPRCDLGNDASEARVKLCLRRHDGRQHSTVVGHDRGRRLVARRLDAEDHDACSDGAGSRHMMSASSRLSV